MQRESGLINEITGCFPLIWAECEVCGREFKFESGWMHYSRNTKANYYCKKCCKTKEDVFKNM